MASDKLACTSDQLTWKRAEEEEEEDEERDTVNERAQSHSPVHVGRTRRTAPELVAGFRHQLKYRGALWCGQRRTMNIFSQLMNIIIDSTPSINLFGPVMK